MNIRIRRYGRELTVHVTQGNDTVTVLLGNGQGVAHALDIAAGRLHVDAAVRAREARAAVREELLRWPHGSQSIGTLAFNCYHAVQQERRCQYMQAPHLTLGAIRDGEPGVWQW